MDMNGHRARGRAAVFVHWALQQRGGIYWAKYSLTKYYFIEDYQLGRVMGLGRVYVLCGFCW